MTTPQATYYGVGTCSISKTGFTCLEHASQYVDYWQFYAWGKGN